MRNASVSPASVTVRASSFGVFWRTAPSTSAIMRSRNDSPAPAVMRTFIKSDRTRVPPVTPERSPPASLTTGADSPVMADSSTVATPSTISPSFGMTSPTDTYTMSPALSSSELTSSVRPFTSLRASVFRLVFFNVSAWAFPLASARASAKFAKRTVNQSINVTQRV